MHMCMVIPAGGERACPQCWHTPTCISQKAVPVILDDSGFGVVEAIATVIAANGDLPRWVHVGELGDTLRRHKGQLVHHQGCLCDCGTKGCFYRTRSKVIRNRSQGAFEKRVVSRALGAGPLPSLISPSSIFWATMIKF